MTTRQLIFPRKPANLTANIQSLGNTYDIVQNESTFCPQKNSNLLKLLGNCIV